MCAGAWRHPHAPRELVRRGALCSTRQSPGPVSRHQRADRRPRVAPTPRRSGTGSGREVYRRRHGCQLSVRVCRPSRVSSCRMKPSIAFFGSSLVSAYWNGAATYYRGIVKALYERGYDVTFYEPDAYERQAHRDIADPEWARVVVYGADHEEHALRAVEQARGADILVKTSGVGVFDELLEAAVLAARRPGSLAIFWDVDAPATLDRIGTNTADPFRA